MISTATPMSKQKQSTNSAKECEQKELPLCQAKNHSETTSSDCSASVVKSSQKYDESDTAARWLHDSGRVQLDTSREEEHEA